MTNAQSMTEGPVYWLVYYLAATVLAVFIGLYARRLKRRFWPWFLLSIVLWPFVLGYLLSQGEKERALRKYGKSVFNKEVINARNDEHPGPLG